MLTVIERLGSLQFDPLEMPGAKNHDLVLFARIKGYARAHCERWLYGATDERHLVEVYNKALNILPASELPYYRSAWSRAQARHGAGILRAHAKVARAILARIKGEGPLSTAAFAEHDAPIDWHWAPTRAGRAVLEALFETGKIGIFRRDGNRRHYDLIERLFPAELLKKRVSVKESMRHRLLSRFRGVGLMGAVASTELIAGTGTAKERTQLLKELVEDGTLAATEIEGVRGLRYLLTSELSILLSKAKGAQKVSFLAPLDPLMWDRAMLRSIFDFDYKWEVYVPAKKRVHGYYVLPVLFGARFVGRIEPRFERSTKTLQILGLTFEAGFAPLEEEGFADALRETLRDYAAFVGATKVKWPRSAAPLLSLGVPGEPR